MSMHQKPQASLSATPWSYHPPRFVGGPDWIEDADGNEIIKTPGATDGPFLVAAVNALGAAAGSGCDDVQPDMPLPFDVQINHIKFGKGVKLSVVLSRARIWHAAYVRAETGDTDGLTKALQDTAMIFRTIANMARDDNAGLRGDIALLAEEHSRRLDAMTGAEASDTVRA